MALTIAETVQNAGGRTRGFDYIRAALATSIILWHGIPISYGAAVEIGYWRSPFGAAMHFVLPMFFALSGFLVAGSLDRCRTLISFFGLRVLRIVPALSVEVTLSALIFGPLLTSYRLQNYFTDARFFRYFLNVFGDIHYELPGLFETNPLPRLVNAQLWTIPFELQCYLAIGGLALAAALRRRALLLLLVLLAQALWAWQAIKLGDDGGSGGASGPVLVIAFLVGILLHLYRDRILLHWSIFVAVLVGGAVLSSLPHGAYYLPLPAAYLTIYLGLLNPRPTWIVSSGDYSYGLYLYGYPLQQAMASAGPGVHHWWLNVGLSLPAALLVAIVSWHIVERPALAARRLMPGFESSLSRAVLGRPVVRGHGADAGYLLPGILTAWVVVAGFSGTMLFVNGNTLLASVMVLSGFFAALLRARQCPSTEFLAGRSEATG